LLFFWFPFKIFYINPCDSEPSGALPGFCHPLGRFICYFPSRRRPPPRPFSCSPPGDHPPFFFWVFTRCPGIPPLARSSIFFVQCRGMQDWPLGNGFLFFCRFLVHRPAHSRVIGSSNLFFWGWTGAACPTAKETFFFGPSKDFFLCTGWPSARVYPLPILSPSKRVHGTFWRTTLWFHGYDFPSPF